MLCPALLLQEKQEEKQKNKTKQNKTAKSTRAKTELGRYKRHAPSHAKIK